jgi:hypothetical protein
LKRGKSLVYFDLNHRGSSAIELQPREKWITTTKHTKTTKKENIFLRFDPLSDLRVLRALRGENILPQVLQRARAEA